ncbi:unnamed protein product [Vicia faba]|uniref:PMI1/PMIR1-2 C-terminal domain-containing protein n=1 Tax=Vicia faba TaxID=3906 RepID=A0AAV0ZWG8_VICFA|nr:unnamed protein product [Vicia faba]
MSSGTATGIQGATFGDGGKHPVFQEKFVVPLIEGLREFTVVVWNSNILTFDGFIGTGKVQLNKVLSQGFDDSSWPLQTKSGRHAGVIAIDLAKDMLQVHRNAYAVVVPAEMGSGIMEVLQCLASVGIEKLSMQANELMPLEDITGKTMQQVAWEAMPALEGTERPCHLRQDIVTGQDTTCVQRDLKGTHNKNSNSYFTPFPQSMHKHLVY